MTGELLLAIDQGTTSTRAIAFDRELRPVASAARSLRVMHPRPGWVEQDPDEILDSVITTVESVLAEVGGAEAIATVGLANQGETVVAWDSKTGRALAPAIVWQCRRSDAIVDRLRQAGLEPEIRSISGLPLDPYFSASKLTWLLEEDAGVASAGRRGTLRFGTVDAWLTACLGNGRIARTDPSTASRTQLFSLADLTWDRRLAAWFGVDPATLPTVVPSAGRLGTLKHPRWGGAMPLSAMICDQQAALAGHAGFRPGALKATYGTGVFVLANAGQTPPPTTDLEASIAWTLPDTTTDYILQGGVSTAGTLVDWLRDGLGIVERTADLDGLARSVPDTGGVEVLPALLGLGAPWYRSGARGAITGLSPGSSRGHIARAALDAIAQRTADIVEVAVAAAGSTATHLRVDGGLTHIAYLMERQADLIGLPVHIAATEESTALGTAALAAIGAGMLTPDAVAARIRTGRQIEPKLSPPDRQSQRTAWRAFVESTSAR